MSLKHFTMFVAAGLFIMAAMASAQNDPIGKVDTVTLYVSALSEGKWMISAHVWNDEELAAIDIPIKYTAGMAKLIVDSVSFVGTRCEGFEQKHSQVDTLGQKMHFGGFAYMSPNKPPLAVGKGEIGRVYISAYGDKKPGAFAVDTATVAPNSTLMLVDKNAKVIVPALKIEIKALTAAKTPPAAVPPKKN